jgi:sigma-K factor processing regulatory protein bofA
MYELNSQLVIGWLIAASFMFVMALICNGVSVLRNFFWRGLMGISTILVVNYMFSDYGLSLGINAFTGFVSGLLGVPGVALMFCLNYFMI